MVRRNGVIGLGADIDNSVIAYVQQRSGNADAQLADPTSVANGMGAILGIVNDNFHTDFFAKNGSRCRKERCRCAPSWSAITRLTLETRIA